MHLVRVRQKHQIAIPTALARAAKIVQGDLLEVAVDEKTGQITLTPKTVVDRKVVVKKVA